jgi:organic radical activating enzyme
MNFAINGTCSKGCSFCFTTEDARLRHTLGEMSIHQLDKYLSFYGFYKNKRPVHILGGEPTQHSNFTGILDFIISKRLRINLVSNLLFGRKTLEHIVKNIKHFDWILPNAAELDERNRITVWRRNYLEIYKAFSNNQGFEKSPRLYLALTLSSNFKEVKMFEYIKWLIKEANYKVKAIRLGLDLTDTYLINNKELGQEIVRIIKFCRTNDIIVQSDCQVPPCLWEGKTKEAVLENSLNYATFKVGNYETICGFMPMDVLPNGSSIHCYPLQHKVKINNVLKVDGVDTLDGLYDKYDELYKENYKNYTLPKDCLDCVFFKDQCNGICGGCLEGNE